MWKNLTDKIYIRYSSNILAKEELSSSIQVLSEDKSNNTVGYCVFIFKIEIEEDNQFSEFEGFPKKIKFIYIFCHNSEPLNFLLVRIGKELKFDPTRACIFNIDEEVGILPNCTIGTIIFNHHHIMKLRLNCDLLKVKFNEALPELDSLTKLYHNLLA